MRTISITCLALATLFTACGQLTETEKPASDKIPDSGMPRRDATAAVTLKPKDRGDVEQTIFIETDLAEEAQLPNIESRASKDAHPRLNLLELKIHRPYPLELPFDVTAKSTVDFTSCPVVIHVKLLLDNVEIGSFSGVVGKSPVTHVFAQAKFDILKGRVTHPKSMLLTAQADALLMPEGTDIATIDPATATTTPERRTFMLGNPVRIDFVEVDGQAPADEPAATDTAPASEPDVPHPAAPTADSPQPEPNATPLAGQAK